MRTTLCFRAKVSKTNYSAIVVSALLACFAGACDTSAPTDEQPAPSTFRCAANDVPGIGGLQTVTINGTASIAGRSGEFDLFSNGLVQLAGTASVGGGVYSSGMAIQLFDSASVTGDLSTEGADVPNWIPQDEVDLIYAYRRNHRLYETANGRDPTSNSNMDFTLWGGDSITAGGGLYYFNSLSISGGSTLRFSGTAYVVIDGPMTISGGSSLEIDDAGQLLIIGTSGDDIEFSGASDVTARLYAPDAPIMISGADTTFTGGLVGGTLQMSDSSSMEVTEDALHIWNPC